LNVGPNLIATFHIVGIIWDYAYWQGLPNPENTFVGGQSVLAGPTDSWVVDFRVPEDEGAYLMLTHAVGAATRGAIGVLSAKKDVERTAVTLAGGPSYTPEQLKEYRDKAARTIAPFEPGSEDLRHPYVHSNKNSVAHVMIKGNSFYPKVIEVPVGTTVEWTNEDVFTFADGEFAGIHNVLAISGPDTFASPMLGHAERFSKKFEKAGEHNYMCTPHPYMKGIVRVVER
jgi:nitrite reductase (NO-forming)